MQVVELGQDTLVSEFSPEGAVWGFQFEPSVVRTMSVPPTAVHSSILKQEIERVGKVESWIVHVAPWSLDLTIPPSPPA
jgi:hypothetical protein